MESEESRARAVAWGLAMTKDTPIAADAYERALLAAFVRGELSLDDVIARLGHRASGTEQLSIRRCAE